MLDNLPGTVPPPVDLPFGKLLFYDSIFQLSSFLLCLPDYFLGARFCVHCYLLPICSYSLCLGHCFFLECCFSAAVAMRTSALISRQATSSLILNTRPFLVSDRSARPMCRQIEQRIHPALADAPTLSYPPPNIGIYDSLPIL